MKKPTHSFYKMSPKEQTLEMLKFIGLALLVLIPFVALGVARGSLLLPLLIFVALLSLLAPFIDTPQLKKKGKLIYYSPLLVSEKEKNKRIIIHGGTLFDYYYVIDRNLSGSERRRFIIQQYAVGLLNLIEACESTAVGDVLLEGTSYILNERTAAKIGFRKKKTDFLQQLVLSFNYLPVMLSYSISKGRLAFPAVNKVLTFTATISEVKENREYLEKLARSLSQK